IHAEYMFSNVWFQLRRTGHTGSPSLGSPRKLTGNLPTVTGSVATFFPSSHAFCTTVATYAPARGVSSSATKKYGGPPRRWPDDAATAPSAPFFFPLDSTMRSSAASGLSLNASTRSGAPLNGAPGVANKWMSRTSSHVGGASGGSGSGGAEARLGNPASA